MLALLLLLNILPGCMAGRDSQGTEFILGYMENLIWPGDSGADIELWITTVSNTPASVTVTTPLYNANWQKTATVQRGNIVKITVPHRIRGQGTQKAGKGVWIRATQEVSVYSVNKETYSTDAYVSLPLDVLGTEYYAMTYQRDAELLVVATQDNTQVSIRWPSTSVSVSYGGRTYGNGQTLTLTLNKFEIFHALQTGSNADFTGAYITSNKPIGAISGNKKIAVPLNAGSADHLTEMLMPVDTWGTTFLTTSTPDRGIGDRYRIVASESGTTVTLSGGGSYSLSKPGDFKEFEISTGKYQTLTSNKPIMVGMFAKTFKNDGPNYGDPAMSLLIPTPQFAADYTWATIKTPDGTNFNNKISVIIESSKTSGLRLDEKTVSWQQTKSISGSTKTHLWTRVSAGSHNIYHTDPSVTFLAFATGTERANSYAYAAGLRLAQINAVCVPSSTTAGDILDNDCDGLIDEETLNGVDDDGDGSVDEDLALPPRVDGMWGSWQGYGSCSVSCGGTGVKTRTRPCDNPAPANNGLYCVGSGSETASCNNGACIVDGNWASWGSWGTCSTTCGPGTWSRARTCTNPAPAGGGLPCSGHSSETSACNLRPCPIDGVWSAWQAWSACSVTCRGVGVRGRTRLCDNPAPLHGGSQCAGAGSETETCDRSMYVCATANEWVIPYYSTTPGTPVNGGFGPWGSWSACSKSCAGGIQMRMRQCNNPVPQFGGDLCSGDFVEKQWCNNIACPNGTGYVQTCPERYFDCKSGNITCIHYLRKCDCAKDCDDASDEDVEWAGCLVNYDQCTNRAYDRTPVSMMAVLLACMTALVSVFWTAPLG